MYEVGGGGWVGGYDGGDECLRVGAGEEERDGAVGGCLRLRECAEEGEGDE